MLDKLKIVSSEKIITFESPANKRLPGLVREIERGGKLRNPLLVRPLDESYLMLDDATILFALEQLKIAHIPIQLAETESLTVHPWQRIVENWHKDDFIGFCRKFPRQIRLLNNVSGPLTSRQAEVRFKDKTSYRISLVSNSLPVRADICIRFVNNFIGKCNSYRVKLNPEDPDPLADFPQASAVVYPPVFSIDELGEIARRGMRLPYGLVRIDQPGRILGVDYSLSILKDPAPLEEKESFLKELIRMRMSADRTAYYDGFIFMFNN